MSNLTDTSLPPTPRVVKLVRGSIIGRILLLLACFGILVVAPVELAIHVNRLNTLMNSGRVSQGTVVESRSVYNKSTTYYLNVMFEHDGTTTVVEREVPRYLYNQYPERSEIPVVSLPGDPNNFEIGNVDAQRIYNYKSEFFPGIIIFGAMMLIFLLVAEMCIYRERVLLSRGEAVTGYVTFSRFKAGKANSTEVKYRYETAFGERTGIGRTMGNKTTEFAEGKEITVLYRKDQDATSKPLKMFQYVRLGN